MDLMVQSPFILFGESYDSSKAGEMARKCEACNGSGTCKCNGTGCPKCSKSKDWLSGKYAGKYLGLCPVCHGKRYIN